MVDKPLLRNSLGEIVPQHYNDETDDWEVAKKAQDVTLTDNNVNLISSRLQEQKTQADEIGGVITFNEDVVEVEIYNLDTTTATFTINNINVIVPPDTAFFAVVGGTPNNIVTVSGTNNYIIGRYA